MKINFQYRISKERTKWGYYITWYTIIMSPHGFEGEVIEDFESYEISN